MKADLTADRAAPHCPERALWLAVIERAISDALVTRYGFNTPEPQAQAARAWFSLLNPDFCEVCRLADVNPEYILRRLEVRRAAAA